jgi:nucleoside-diphosphate-sugar epimerase
VDKFFITGGQGCIGAWVVRRLLDDGTPFTVFDLAPNDGILQQLLSVDEAASLQRVFGDVSDTETVEQAVRESGATAIIHLAGLQIPTCRANPVLGATVNVLGTLNVFEAARKSEGRIRSVAYASSAAVIGPPEDYDGPIVDDTPHRPRTHYGYFKLTNEGNARIFWQDHGVPSAALRPYAVYGIGREIGLSSGPSLALRATAAGQDYAVAFSGPCGFNYTRDIADQFIGCARKATSGARAFNVVGHCCAVEDFISVIEEVAPEARGRIRCEGGPLPVAAVIDETGLRELLGTVPLTPLADSIRDTIDRYKDLFDRGVLQP